MKLLSNHLLVERVKRVHPTNSMIVLPESVLDDNNTGGPKEFLVIQTGPGRINHKGVMFPIECSPGDRIICHSYTTGSVEVGSNRFVITSDMILAVIPVQA